MQVIEFPRSLKKRAAVNFATQYAKFRKFAERLKMECLNTRFFLLTPLYEGYCVKLKHYLINNL